MIVRRFALVMTTGIVISVVLLAAVVGRHLAPSAAQGDATSVSQNLPLQSIVPAASQKKAAIEHEAQVCRAFDTWVSANVEVQPEVKPEVIDEDASAVPVIVQPSVPHEGPAVAEPLAAPSPTVAQPEPVQAIDPKVERGRQAAIQRRSALKKLIALDPRAAIAQAVPYDVRRSLPAVIRAELETPISTRGDLLLAARLSSNRNESQTAYYHEAIIGDRIYNAHVYGWRSTQTTQKNIPLQGIAIDGELAVDENSTRLLSVAEIDDRKISTDATCPVSSKPAKATVVAEAAGITYPLCSSGHISNMESSIRAAQSGGGLASSTTTDWTTGVKKILVMRADCSDEPGDPVSFSSATQIMSEADAFMRANSNGMTSFIATIPPTVRLPQTAAWYRTNGGPSVIYRDAQIACRAIGYDTLQYDLDVVTYLNLEAPGTLGGALIGSKGCWIQTFVLAVVVHELGHNFGLKHSSAWISSDGTPNGAGSHDDYGEFQDVMGYYHGTANHYNAIAKNMLGWLDDSRVQDVATSGTYHVLPHDTTTSGIAALRIHQADGNDYWFSTRALQAENGVFVHWKYPAMNGGNSELLDFTPLTNAPNTEAMLPGISLFDATPYPITATNLRMYADGSADVQITFDPSNQPPYVSAGPDFGIRLPAGVTLDGTSSDDGLPTGTVTYTWTMDSGPGVVTFADASTVDTTATFSIAGFYVLRLTADDSALSAFDTMYVVVSSAGANGAPLVSAGPNRAITLPAGATLDGTVSDDGQPIGGTITHTWTMDSGPGIVMFAAANAIDTTATFSIAGTYMLRLTASDTVLSAFDTMYVLVTPAATVNGAPVVSAGPDLAITLPAGATLDGTISDDGLPIGGNILQNWTKDSGPGIVTFAAASAVDTTATFSSAGTYVLRLTASDSSLLGFDTATVVVSPAGANAAPVVSAGPDLAITLPAGATLDGTISDDGLPIASVVTQTWTMDSGPGIVTFVDATAVDTTATFSIAGTYVLRLTASDTALSAFDTVTVVVSPAALPNLAPVVSAGPDLAITLPAGATLDATISDDGLPIASVVTQTWTMDSGPGVVTFVDATAVDTTATFSIAGTYVLRLTASDTALSAFDTVTVVVSPAALPNLAPVVSAGPDLAITLPAGATLDGTISDDGLPIASVVTQTWTMDSGPGIVTFMDATAVDTTATFSIVGTYVLRLTASDTALSAFDTVTVVVSPAALPNLAPVVSAGPDLAITLPAGATLDGTISDDGLPIASVVTQTWTMDSGPGVVTFVDATAVDTTATFSIAGTYVLRLTASDTALSAFDTVTVVVSPAALPNLAPVVSAGPDLAITLPAGATLDGTISDDGLPIGSVVTQTWTMDSGPGIVTFVDVSAVDTTATFSIAGTYVLRLTASDTALSAFDTVTVVVSPAALPNLAPVVNAGPDLAITLPAGATLDGTISDDGLPIGSIVTQTWTMDSGPGIVTFVDATAVDTTATFSIAGTYVLRLTASDTALSAFDTVTVVVSPAALPNLAPVVSAGPDLAITLPAGATLDGTISDDGLPIGSIVTQTWTMDSGPGIVTFSAASAVDTTATFSIVGTYVLRLTASDTALSAFDTVTLVVLSPSKTTIHNQTNCGLGGGFALVMGVLCWCVSLTGVRRRRPSP